MQGGLGLAGPDLSPCSKLWARWSERASHQHVTLDPLFSHSPVHLYLSSRDRGKRVSMLNTSNGASRAKTRKEGHGGSQELTKVNSQPSLGPQRTSWLGPHAWLRDYTVTDQPCFYSSKCLVKTNWRSLCAAAEL